MIRNGINLGGYSKFQMEWRQKNNKKQLELLDNIPVDKIQINIWHLEWAITEIAPGSRAWNMGRVSALRAAIRALKREEKTNGKRCSKK